MASSPQSRADAPWTTRRLLGWIGSALASAGVDAPRVCAELLVAHVLGCDRLRLYADPDRPTTPAERSELRALVSRALQHEPVQYLVGEAWFFSMPFRVDRRVLIPRPETELLVEAVVQAARDRKELAAGAIADLGTGSGCIIVAALKHLPRARGLAVDRSADALQVARINADRHGVEDRLDFLTGDLYEPLDEHPAGRRLAALLANPPYIADPEWADVAANVRQEPESALRGGADGLDLIRPILAGASERLAPGGLFALEFGAGQTDAVLALAEAEPGLTAARIESDFEGRPRALVTTRA